MKDVLISFALGLIINSSQAQNIPDVGKPCPDFVLNNVTHYPKKKVTLKDFSGQWLFLDFWFTGCSSCIKSFPKISELQKSVKGKAQFILIGHNGIRNSGGGRNIEAMFEKLRIKQNLNIAAAYDSTLAKSWGVESMPHIVIVDPLGIVRYITDGFDMTIEKIQGIVNGEAIALSEKEKVYPEFVSNLIDIEGKFFSKATILNHSILLKWNGERGNPGYDIGEYATFPIREKEKGFKYAKVSLEWLYSNAFLAKSSAILKFWGEPLYNKVYPFPVYELKDSSAFQYDFNDNRGFYNYSLTIPPAKATKENLMKYMQQDLERTFGYNAFVEEREMPVWKLVAKPGAEAKVKTNGGPRYYQGADGTPIAAGFAVRNVSLKDYLMYLCFYLNEKEKHPFIEATGIKSNIDLTIDADLTDLNDVKRELQKHGLDLVLGTKKMKVLVIRDPKN